MNRRKSRISKDEWFIIGAIIATALVLIALLPRMMDSTWFTDLIPPLQYLSYNIGFILLTVVMFGAPASYALKHTFHFWTMFRSGISSWLIFSFMLDMWQPPFAFSPGGEQLILRSESLVGTSVDYMTGWTYLHLFSIQNVILNIPVLGNISLLFVLVYFITPILAVFVAALLLKPTTLVKMLGDKAL